MSPVRCFAAGTCAALFAVLTLCLSGALARAQAPIVVSGTPVQLGALTGGGWDGSQEPVGGTFVIGVNGDVLIGDGYTGNFLQITPSGTDTVLAAGLGGSAAALDSYGNLYFGGNYNANVYKLPYNAATGAYVGWTTAPTVNCLGGNQDTAPCIFAPAVSTFMNGTLKGSGNAGYAGVAFDAQGNFFFESNTLPGTNPNSIYECNLACIASSSATPTLIYKDTATVGALAIDPWGNIFFVDGNNSTGKVTNLNEIKLSSGSYASSPTVVLSYTNAAGYGNGISGLAIAVNGSVYISTNGDGIFAIPNTQSGGPNVSAMYMIASQGGKGVALDSNGNVYGVPYNGGDVVSFIPVNSFVMGTEPVGTAATAVNATVFDSSGSCTPTLSASTTEFGVTSTEFTAAAGSKCSTAFGGANGTFSSGPLTAAGFSSFSVTLNFTPAAVGERNATLTVADTTNSASGSAVLTGVGQGAMANVDPGALTAFTKGLTTPASVIADAAGDVFVADEGASKVFEFPAGSTSTTTPTSIGSGFVKPYALAFDANGDLFVADNGVPDVVEIANTGTTGAFAAGTQTTVVSSTMTFNGAALKNAEALALGPNGTLYISDTGNSRVVSYNLLNGQGGVTLATSANGLSGPSGLAVDSSGNLYVADLSNDLIDIISSAGVVSTVAPPNVTQPLGVAVDASGSLIVGDGSSSNIVRIPNLSGTLTTSKAVTIETVSPQVSSLWMDPFGDLYVASAGGGSANVIQRTAGAINLGTVADGANQTGNVYLMNAGNATATLANPVLTEPSNYPTFSLEPAASNSCTAGSSGPVGAWCAFTAEFAPPSGTTAGPYSGTADILVSTPSISIPVIISGTAAASAAQPQTITWTPPATGYVGQVLTLSATATSGLAVTFTTTTPSVCTVAGNTTLGFTASFIATGTCTISANQAGGSVSGTLYGAAPTVTNSIIISNITPAGKPALFMTQTNSSFPSILTGGVLAGPIAAGTSIGVGNNGYVAVSETYGGAVAIYNLAAGTVASLGAFSNPGGVAADSAGNLYISGQYNNQIAKLPYVNGAYATLTAISGSTPNCTSSTTTECILAPITTVSAISGIGPITFDSAGDLFLATDSQGTAKFSIWECTAACLAGGTGAPAPVMLFQEPTGTSPNQLYVGSLSVDPWGNLFFTDTNFISQSSNSNNEASYSDVYELPTSTGAGFGGATTGFAAAPTLLQTYTDGTPGGYDDNLDALVVAPNGTVYYATLYDGVFAIPNTQSGGPVIANQYPVSGSGAKVLGVDKNGNLYEVSSALSVITINDLTVPNAQYEGPSVQASAAVIDAARGYCPGQAPTLVFTSTNPDFSATQTAGGTCKGLAIGSGFTAQSFASSYPATVFFNPLNPGAQTTTLTLSDSAGGGVGTATVAGLAQTTPQTISFTAPTTTTYTYAAPPSPVTITLTVANGGSNFPAVFSVDSTSTGAGTFSNGTTTMTGTVTGTNTSVTFTVTQAGTIVIDAYEPAGLASNNIYYSQSNTAKLTLTINPAAQAITFTPINPLTYTYSASPQVTVQLSATGGASGNPVTFSVDSSSTGKGTVSATTTVGNASLATLTVTQAGSIIIDANQALTVDYAAAPQVQQTLQVNQAAQTITFIPPTQPIHFIVTSPGIAGGITVQISAVGGPSDNAIVFTVDKSSTMTGSFGTSTVSGATSTATLTIPVQGGVISGTIVIDATQPASTDYAAVTVTPLGSITILPPLPTQLITFNNPGTQVVGTALTLSATASSSLPVSYASTTTSICTVSGSAVSFASSITSASTCTIVAAQPGDNINWAAAPSVSQSFTVNPKGQNPNFTLNLSLSSLTLQPGTVGVTQLTITSQNNFTGSLSLACSGLPSGYSCTFNPSTLTISAGGTANTTLTVTPPATAALVRQGTRPLIPITALAVALCFIGFRKRARLQSFLLLALAVGVLGLFAACGGTSSTTTAPPTTSSATVTISASGMAGASGSVQQTATLTVTLE